MSVLDIDDILNESADGTKAAPDFVTPPNGKYKLKINSCKLIATEKKDKKSGELVKGHSIQAILAVASTVEVGADTIPVADGSIFSQRWQWTEQGKEYFKQFCEKVLGTEACKGATWKELMTELPNNHEFECRIRVKETDDFTNVNLSEITQIS